MTDIGAFPYVAPVGPAVTLPQQLRGLAWLRLSDTGQLGAATSYYDGGGGALEFWAYSTDIPCRLDPLAGDERIVASKLSDRSTHLITTPTGVPATAANRFAITGRGTFEITAVRGRTDDPLTFFEAVQVS